MTLVALDVAPRRSEARPVRVRGEVRLRAQASFLRDRSVLEVRGKLADDARLPLGRRWLELRGGLNLDDARACPRPQVNVAPDPEGDGKRVETSEEGEFCLRWVDPPPAGNVTIAYAGDAYYGAAELRVVFDRARPQRLATAVRFDPRPSTIDLDRDQVVVTGGLELVSTTVHAERGGHRLQLVDERGRSVAEAETGGDGRVRLLVDPASVGGPGRGVLRLEFAGDDQLAAAADEQPIVRKTTARVRLVQPIAAADAGDTAEIVLRIDTKRGPVNGGVVEAWLGETSVGSGDVVDGSSNLVVTLDPELSDVVALSIRYLPASPFFRSGVPLTVEVPIAPPSIALRMFLTSVVLGAAAWIVASWRRSKHAPPPRELRPAASPGVHVVETTSGAGRRWSGTVVDAHDGTFVADALVRVRAPSLDDDDVVVACRTDSRGTFTFELDARPVGAELAVEGRLHTAVRQSLPSPGVLRVALVTRRRSLLQSLVRWVERRGPPYPNRSEATPEEVAAVARTHRRPDVAAWADAMEAVAFGPEEVDAGRGEEVRRLEPGRSGRSAAEHVTSDEDGPPGAIDGVVHGR
ncbi:MAG: hypothetical protein AAGN82_03725 [Myxococcota bacterium]